MSGFFNGSATLTGEMRPGDGTVTNAMVSTSADIARSKLAQNANAVYHVPWGDFRVHDAIQTLLPAPSANDDLGFPTSVAMGTVSPYIGTADLKATTTTCYARFQFALPPEYDPAQTVTLRIRASMVTTVADATATIDAQVYECDRAGGVGADICATAAHDMNSLDAADYSFTITPTNLVAGDKLDIRIAIAVTDAATGTAVIGRIYEVAMLLDIRG
jgi:hypothetical protein